MTSRMAFAGPGPQLGVHKSGYQAEGSTRVQGEGDLKHRDSPPKTFGQC